MLPVVLLVALTLSSTDRRLLASDSTISGLSTGITQLFRQQRDFLCSTMCQNMDMSEVSEVQAQAVMDLFGIQLLEMECVDDVFAMMCCCMPLPLLSWHRLLCCRLHH